MSVRHNVGRVSNTKKNAVFSILIAGEKLTCGIEEAVSYMELHGPLYSWHRT
jgi:hypothetical protein